MLVYDSCCRFIHRMTTREHVAISKSWNSHAFVKLPRLRQLNAKTRLYDSLETNVISSNTTELVWHYGRTDGHDKGSWVVFAVAFGKAWLPLRPRKQSMTPRSCPSVRSEKMRTNRNFFRNDYVDERSIDNPKTSGIFRQIILRGSLPVYLLSLRYEWRAITEFSGWAPQQLSFDDISRRVLILESFLDTRGFTAL